MRKPKHGGGLLRVGNPDAPGRPPSVIRERLRGSFAERIELLEAVADGEALQRIRVPLGAVLPHVKCPKCEGKLEVAGSPADALLVEIEGMVSAPVGERLKSLDLMAKYGLGTTKELTVEDVKERLAVTISLIRARCPKRVAESLLAEMRGVWR